MNYDGVISELQTALQRIDAEPVGMIPFRAAVVIDCARDVVQEWERCRAEGSGQ